MGLGRPGGEPYRQFSLRPWRRGAGGMRDTYAPPRSLFRAPGRSLRQVERPAGDGVDSSTPAGRMVFSVLAQLAEFEWVTLIERTNSGRAAARKRGKHLGRRHSLKPHQQQEAKRMREEEGQTYAQMAALFDVSRSVLWRSVNTPARVTNN